QRTGRARVPQTRLRRRRQTPCRSAPPVRVPRRDPDGDAARRIRSRPLTLRCVARQQNPPPAPGLVVVDKPAGMTSHDVVARVRRIMGTRKVGHAGTLDPMATGILVLGIERATKLLGHLSLDRKTYLARMVLGATTTTEDSEGDSVDTAPTDEIAAVTDAEIAAAMTPLRGEIHQVPSAVSAIKVDGKRAYQRVRDGEHVELDPRPVTVHRFDLLHTRRTEHALELDALVDCSSGTYVRALARDLGVALGVGGHLGLLRRTTVGPFTLDGARTLEQLADEPRLTLDLTAAVDTVFGSSVNRGSSASCSSVHD